MHPIPEAFSQRMIEMSGEEGRQWIARLPEMLESYAQRWSLTLEPAFPLSYNYVAPGIRTDGTEVVLKLGVPNRELLSEMHALQVYAGRGIVALLAADFEQQVFLLERIRPGMALVNLKDDDERTQIACQTMQQLWVPGIKDRPLLTIENWTAGLNKLRPHFNGTTGPFPPKLVDTAEHIFADLIPNQGRKVLLHGDLHHWNILSATRQPWLALDPKGVIGEREYEVGALLRNPDLGKYNRAELKQLQERRLAIMAEILGFDRQRMLGWGLAQAVLSAWWSIEDHGSFGQNALRCADVLYELFLER